MSVFSVGDRVIYNGSYAAWVGHQGIIAPDVVGMARNARAVIWDDGSRSAEHVGDLLPGVHPWKGRAMIAPLDDAGS